MTNGLMTVYRWLDENLEKVVLVTAYAFCGGIIAVEVFRRYAFGLQAPWSTYVPSYLFLWLTWLGCSYCVKLRSHLVFNEVRDRLPRTAQYILMQFDYLLFGIFGALVIYYSMELVAMQYEFESIVPGTDDLPSWIFYSATPVGWTLLMWRAIQNIIEDYHDFRSGEPLKLRGAAMTHD